ncbi:MAG: SDR family oxidoreductase [Firmicutes bacterium]|nr:SDR family oxidoreductase [Bacillota bacterium]
MYTAVVTGGTSGIGKEISRQFLERGDTVIAVYKSDDKKAKETTTEFNNPRFSTVKLDITNEVAVKKFFCGLKQCDYLINCAGITHPWTPLSDTDLTEAKRVFDVNFFAKMNCAKYALDLLKKSNRPRIINIASRFGVRPLKPGTYAYSCSEAAIIMMTGCLALDYAKFGVRTNTISPSYTLTPMTKGKASDNYEKVAETIASLNPLKRIGKPEDVAGLVMFLCSDSADYINGENINVNGGVLLQ